MISNAIELSKGAVAKDSHEDESCAIDPGQSRKLSDLVQHACDMVGPQWTQDARSQIALAVMRVLTPACGAPYSIDELKAMEEEQWEADVLTPLKLNTKIRSFRAKMIVRSIQDLLTQ